ncbi:MAG: Protein of unknown function (DUF2490) [Candidatus Nitrotoga sp. CP45]|nr:MAG: Protein of unknown function (DUF2490) [Candidatus Nitrotoga sp. CP45]
MFHKINISMALTISGLLFSGSVTAAKDINDFQTWGTATAVGSLENVNPALKNFKYWAEFQGRFGDDTSRFSQAIIRPGIGYAINNTTSVWVGYALVPTAAPFSKTTFNERRFWQQLLWSDNFTFGTASSRSRLEERLAPRLGDDTAMRFRQMFKISVPLTATPAYSVVASNEYFLNLNNNDWGPRKGFDQNRAFIGIGYNFNKEIKSEIGYMNQYINLPRTSVNRNGHILSINFYFNY